MEMPAWMSLLIQVPLVGVFIWYSLEMAKKIAESQQAFMDALDKRDAAFEKRNEAVIGSISDLNKAISIQLKELEQQSSEHDKYVRENIGRIKRKEA